MRATRAYIAGFGTAGSLLAGAAMVFVLATAVIAFRGWPQVGGATAPSSIVLGKPVAHTTPSGVNRQLVAAATSPVTTRAGRSAGAATTRKHATAHHSGAPASQVVNTGQPVGTGAGQTSTATPPPQHVPPFAGCGSSCGSHPSGGNPVTTVVQTTAGALGSTVSSTTKSLGSTVNGVAKVIATKLGLGQTGTAAGAALNGASSVVTGAGTAVGGLLGGH